MDNHTGASDHSTEPMKIERKEQGATRQNILQFLRRRGQMTAIELSQSLDIGAVGIRQHLALLERDGLVEVAGLRRSVGRPSHLYTLTPEAEQYFPKSYDQLTVEVLAVVAEQYGKEAINQVLAARRQKLAHAFAPRIAGKPRQEQVAELATILAEQGHMCEYEQREDGSFILKGHNCPIDCVARHYPQFCLQDAELYQELLGVPIKRHSNIANGDLCCTFSIPGENGRTEQEAEALP
jgi:predicted ArsR family transcriptional regulator